MIQSLNCSPSMNTLIDAIKLVLNIIRWAIPIVLIILGSVDMFKAMASNDDKKAGEAKSTFIRRLIYAVVAFLIPFLVELAFNLVASIVTNDGTAIHNENLNTNNFFDCWYKNGQTDEVPDNNEEEDDEVMVRCCDADDNLKVWATSDQECVSRGYKVCSSQPE